MKKIFLWMVIVLVSVFMFGKTELVFWHYWDGENGKKLETLVETFNSEHPEIEVQPVFIPGSDLLIKIQTSILSGQTPDFAISDIIGVPLILDTGKVVDLMPFVEKDNYDLNDFYESTLVYGRRGESLYSIPVSSSNLGLFWNKNLFKEAGLDPETPPKTWEELIEFSEMIKEKTGKFGYELFLDGGEGTTWQWQIFLWQAGGEFLDPISNYRKSAFNSESGVKALQFWVDLTNKYKTSPIAPWGLFGRGEAAMVMDGSWMTQFFPMQVDFELGSAIFPYPEDGKPASNMGGEQIFIFEGSKAKVEASWEFIKWFTSTEIQIDWDKATGFIPVKKSVAESENYNAYIKNTNRLLLPFIEVQQYAQARPPIKEYSQVSDIVSSAILSAIYKKSTPQQALDQAAKQVDLLLSKE
ncbi:MAG: multiple sugar transport system substrate-binding protein [Petrotoga sp.]|jgi:multiple sugar transport system substrate-binding protein|nr:multiple sugar transport system substrate-binding protein [Petrotoga sp.]